MATGPVLTICELERGAVALDEEEPSVRSIDDLPPGGATTLVEKCLSVLMPFCSVCKRR